ncbi:terminase large subunit domain-containing protein [Streptomyces beijiangensis]|uniref:Terminase family protein n=1 Tax=Streptomyces beijiangensis TaxID=163361 RepID=A0A939JDV5_9ACTN|nr:terminase family protein [Streptomyces beijiangensis]MBO0512416.1 terminase family protein [Streptomyces beijiangensis]
MAPSSSDRVRELLAVYRGQPAGVRRALAGRATPRMRALLAEVERSIAMDASPGALAAIVTDRREMQARHLNMVDQAWIDMAEGRAERVMLSMPPRHGKSRRASRWGPLWYLRKYPDRRVMIASYSADLADEHGRWIRDAIDTWGDLLGIQLNRGSKAANRFDIAGHEGGLVAAGIGGGLTGKGATIAIVDDPVKDMADADSPTMRKRAWDWWQSVLQTRLEPDGAICVIQTRWHEDDLSGRIIAEAEANEWKIIDLPAIADNPDDILGRAVGEPLWPERFDATHHAKTRKRVGERVWAALYQQQPRPPEGGVWSRSWIDDNRTSVIAFGGLDMARIVVAVDPAGGDSTVSDETGIVGAARGYDGHLYVLDDRSGSMGANAWGRTACRLALDLKADAIVVESNYGGDMARQIVRQAWEQLQREGVTRGLLMPMVLEVTAKVGKRLRAEPIAQLYEQGLIHHIGHFPKLEDQMVTWVAGMDSPDRMDAGVHALTELADPDQLDTGVTTLNDKRLDGRR